MMSEHNNLDSEVIRKKLEDLENETSGKPTNRFLMTTLGGALPIVGSLISALSSAWSEYDQNRFNRIFEQWLRLQEEEIKEIAKTLAEVLIRLDPADEAIRSRLESAEYQALVRKCFRDWSAAESESKRSMLRNLLANAASFRLTSDDVIRIFIDWIANYSELHFRVLTIVHKNEGLTRAEIWQRLGGEIVRDDSAEADLFKLAIHDLTVGYVIRQDRETNSQGQYLRKTNPTKQRDSFIKSAFADDRNYVLTALGRQFVHYALNDLVPKIHNDP